jgi:hypothetical protein
VGDAISGTVRMVGDYASIFATRANACLQRATTNVVIDAPEVRRFSFSQYLANLLARLTPSQPVGRLK